MPFALPSLLPPALSSTTAALALALQIAPPTPPIPRRAPAPVVSVPAQLMITDLRVVEDPVRANPRSAQAPWSFLHLVTGIAGPNDPSLLVLDWLEQWEVPQSEPGGPAPPRPRMRELVIDPWLQASGGDRLDLSIAPFKLLAIVNRMDLREHAGNVVTSAGEGRFVFGVTRMDGRPLPPVAGPAPGGLLVILEYELPATDVATLRSWAEAWAALGASPLGSDAHRAALEQVTRRFTDARFAGRPNGSAIAQVRTNDVALAPVWELREFRLDASGWLRQASVAGSPDMIGLDGTPALASLVNGSERDLLDGTFSLPAALESASSLSGPFQRADFPGPRSFVATPLPGPVPLLDVPWSAAGIRSNDARHAFGLGTCNGCHRNETGTPFAHVTFPVNHQLPASLGMPAALSGFLRGATVPDPVVGSTTRSFADLERRRLDFQQLLAGFAAGAPLDPRIRLRVH